MGVNKFLLILSGLFSVTLLGNPLTPHTEELLKLKWKRYVGKFNPAYTCQPLIWKDRIYHATNGDERYESDANDRFYAFNENGTLLWSFKWKNDLNGVIANNRFVAFTSDDGWIFVFDHSGHLLWKRQISDASNESFSTIDLNSDGYPDLLVGNDDGYLYALNGKNGTLLWKFGTCDRIESSPAIADIDGDGKVEIVFGDSSGYLFVLNGEDGTLLWKFKTDGVVDSPPSIADINEDGKLEVIFANSDIWDNNNNYLYALRGKNGTLIWKFRVNNSVETSPAVADIDRDGKLEVIFGSNDFHLYALKGEDGSLLWEFKTNGDIESSPVVADINGDGKLEVVFGCSDKYLYVLNGKNGSLLWKYKLGGDITSSPAVGDIDRNGKLDIAVASKDGYLYLFESTKKGGKVVWSRWHGDGWGTGTYWNALSFAEANLKGDVWNWKPQNYLKYWLADFVEKKLKENPLSVLEKERFEPSKEKEVYEANLTIAKVRVYKRAKVKLFKKISEKFQRILNDFLKKEEKYNTLAVEKIYKKVLKEAFNEVSYLKGIFRADPKGEIYLLLEFPQKDFNILKDKLYRFLVKVTSKKN